MRPGLMVTPSLRLLRPLGAGGMGSIWLAEHLALRTEVVVKFMSVELGADPESRARFSREAVAASQVKSPHVVQTFDHGLTADGVPFIVMERLDGEDLAQRIRREPLPLGATASVLTQVCRALTRAHGVGIVHRDIKPANIFLCDVGGDEPFVKLLDFGIAKATLELGLGGHTRTGAMMGTPYYMSPEQFSGAKNLDFRTDLWALGVVAFECVTGVRPFQADSLGALATVLLSGETPAPSSVHPGIPAAMDAWFSRAVAREPGARFQSASELAEAFALVAKGAGLAAFATAATHPVAAPPAAGGLPFLTTGGASALEKLAPRSESGATAGEERRSRLRVLGAVGVAGVVGVTVAMAVGWTRMHGAAGAGSIAAPVLETPSAREAPSSVAAAVASAPGAVLVAPVEPPLATEPPDAAPARANGVHVQPPRVRTPPKPSSADPFEPHVF
jgi:hypothetical protein